VVITAAVPTLAVAVADADGEDAADDATDVDGADDAADVDEAADTGGSVATSVGLGSEGSAGEP